MRTVEGGGGARRVGRIWGEEGLEMVVRSVRGSIAGVDG